MTKLERFWGVAMTVLSAVLVAVIVATPAIMEETGVEFMADHITDQPVVTKLESTFVAQSYLEEQNYNTQIYRFNQSIQRLEREMIRPDTTEQERQLYQNQKNDLERQKADEQTRWQSRQH